MRRPVVTSEGAKDFAAHAAGCVEESMEMGARSKAASETAAAEAHVRQREADAAERTCRMRRRGTRSQRRTRSVVTRTVWRLAPGGRNEASQTSGRPTLCVRERPGGISGPVAAELCVPHDRGAFGVAGWYFRPSFCPHASSVLVTRLRALGGEVACPMTVVTDVGCSGLPPGGAFALMRTLPDRCGLLFIHPGKPWGGLLGDGRRHRQRSGFRD